MSKGKDKELQVEWEDVAELVPYANNANIHTEEQIGQIVASIKEFGFNDPIAVWTNADGASEVIEGHGRIMAAQKLGMDKVPVIHLDALTDEQRRAYTHVHNQLTRNSEWDWETLAEEMEALEFDWGELGFDAFSIMENFNYDGHDSQGVDPEDLKEYAENADSMLKSFSIIITCFNEEEVQAVRRLLGIKDGEKVKRLYQASELL